jgi:hypothetical protein
MGFLLNWIYNKRWLSVIGLVIALTGIGVDSTPVIDVGLGLIFVSTLVYLGRLFLRTRTDLKRTRAGDAANSKFIKR